MRFPRFLTLALLLPFALLSACDRGAHPAQTGQIAPDFNVSDGSTSIHLASYRGRVVLLNFWATWCEPCVVEMPSLLDLHHDQPDLAILAVSIDEDPRCLQQLSHPPPRGPDRRSATPAETAAKLYHSEAWPETYVIDRQGVIRRKFVGAQDWSSPEVRAYLKSL